MIDRRFSWILCIGFAFSTVCGDQPDRDSVRPKSLIAVASSPATDHAVVQTMLRIESANAQNHPAAAAAIDRYLADRLATAPSEYLVLVQRLKVDSSDQSLLNIAAGDDPTAAVRAAKMLLPRDRGEASLQQLLQDAADDQLAARIATIGAVDTPQTAAMLVPYLVATDADPQTQSAIVAALGSNWHGEMQLLELARENKIPSIVTADVRNRLLSSWTDKIRDQAAQIPSLNRSDEAGIRPLPLVRELKQITGDIARGQEVFFGKATCSKCHQVGGAGQMIGPDLSQIGSKLSTDDMYSAIFHPSAAISHQFEMHVAMTFDGVIVSGLLVGSNDDEIQIKSVDANVKTIARDDLEQLTVQNVSLMPENLHNLVTDQELADLVDYMQMLKSDEQSRFNADAGAIDPREDHSPQSAVAAIDVADDLQLDLFAYEPMLYSPTAIDVDSRGRIWVCEAINYRHFRNPENPVRSEGDRILIVTDTDGDGTADTQHVYYQGTDIDSPHGVCVLGDRVIVSAGENVWVFRDTDGDDVADEHTAMFTGISGSQHDHGIHTLMPGPDGKLYFNFGNEGKQLLDRNGKPVVDKMGNLVSSDRNPYQQGMVFRCDLDGSNVETLGWNFRNNWEVAVDSYGAMWQSDNDDDGNRGTRINFVMEYGNYGYRDEISGDYWNSQRITMEDTIPRQHWHLNDPGVVPNLLQTGAGSPTGIMVYEGDALPYKGQMIHTDPGPNIVRTYPVKPQAAGYTATMETVAVGTRDQWFRPVDAVAAPDGSVIIADWYDPGVGGHRMGDVERGRLFRLRNPKSKRYVAAEIDVSTIDGAWAALESPNRATQFLAGQSLRQMLPGTNIDWSAILTAADDPVQRARRMWVLAGVPEIAAEVIQAELQDPDLNVRLAAIRAARQSPHVEMSAIIDLLIRDPEPQVRREIAIAIHESDSPKVAPWCATLADQYEAGDRWMLEAIGIAARGRWDAVFTAWIDRHPDDWDTPAGRDVIWRARTGLALPYLMQLIREADTVDAQQRYFRAIDFIQSDDKASVLEKFLQPA